MTGTTDMELVREFARNSSEAAFTELARRHLNLVYSVALRYTGPGGDAADIAQAVFIILARKAGRLNHRTVLTGWLYETTRFTAARWQRTAARRHAREQEAYMQSLDTESAAAWQQLAPHLEAAMSQLAERDRTLLALRFYENKTALETAALLGIGEEAAQKRVSRALEKLRTFVGKRGIALTAAAIAGAVSTNSVQAAPVALAKTISAVALAKGAAASTSTLTLVKGALKIMAWTKAKAVIVASAIVLLAAGTTTVTVKEIQKHKLSDAWRVRFFNPTLLEQAPPQVKILPSKFPPGGVGCVYGAWLGIGQSVATIIADAYLPGAHRTKCLTELPVGNYDFIAKLPEGSRPQDVSIALQKEIRRKFGLVGHLKMQNTDVLLLTVKTSNANGLTIHDSQTPGSHFEAGEFGKFSLANRPLHELTDYLAGDFQVPIVNGTGIESNIDATLNWNRKDWEHPNLDGLKQALADQLGLELVPTNMPIEMLVVEKVK